MFMVIVLTVPVFPLMLKVSLEELTTSADMVAIGKAVEKECRWGENGKWIYTYVKLSVDEYIKGELLIFLAGNAVKTFEMLPLSPTSIMEKQRL